MGEAMPQRIQLRRAKGWRLPEGAVSVARPGPWGNPFVVGQDGTTAECIRLYEMMLAGLFCLSAKATPEQQMACRGHVIDQWRSITGKALACWCRSGQPCHADALLRVANPLRCEAPPHG